MQEAGGSPVGMPLSQEAIAQRLAALSRWQDEQKRLLQERQSNQRVLLGLEQRNMYKMLGLLHQETESCENSVLEEWDEEHSIQMPRLAADPDDHEPEIPMADPQPAKPKRPFLRRGEGLKQRFKINPDQLRLENLPRYKFANAHPQFRTPQTKKGILKKHKSPPNPAPPPAPKPPAQLDLNEQRFQQMLIGKNACSSTPDLKSSYASSTTASSISPRVRFVEQKSTAGQTTHADDEASSEASPMTGVCWAKVLDTQSIKPAQIQRRSAQIRVEDDSNVSIFELLEQKATEGNIDMNSSCIRTFMARKDQRRRIADDSDHIVVTQQVRQMRLQPQVDQVLVQELQEEDEEDNEPSSDQTLTMTPIQVGNTQVRVRFSDSNDTHEYSDATSLNDGSNIQLFEQFKSALFQALEQKKKSSPSQQSEEPITKDLQEKANLVRSRLEELETEIATFKEQNAQLLRLRQQHELEKAKCTQDHMEAMERVHDEKIQAEIYLHDERMKIEEERRKFEQQMRLHKSNANSKEKKEIAALKQEVEALQLQLKQKEQAHVSAQARLRAQLRASEKEQRNYRDEIELLRRENKRLEQELVKIGRENNSKMLQEINRNIARLAPKVLPSATMSDILDENGRRTQSLDGTAGKPAKQREPHNRRQSSGSAQVRSRSRSLGRNKKGPYALDESFASSSSAEAEEVQPPVTAAKADTPPPAANSSSDFKREITNEDGSKDIWYPNGNLKKISADGMNVRMLYFNKDIKETNIREGTVKYYYAETNTWHTSYLDGLEILEFPNGQTEHRRKDGTVEIHFPNNSIKIVDPSDTEKLEEWRYANGTHLVQLRNGDKILNLPNGQKEIHTKLNKRREYPDGTVKLLYPDGSQETRYSNGRVRLKDKDGKLIMDTDYAKY
ncbi:centromere protein J [Drosophila mauritiana]|uniref:Centromere protein J n=1 Tax=Drosophila mauritiana TaxID=7226 RepID=A0A6P8KXF1_DROMA|nr:centromere protein J [Drosophila mauritiana]